MKVTIPLLFVLSSFTLFCQNNELYEFIGRNNKYGFIDKKGKIVIKPKYFEVQEFNEGLCFVCISLDKKNGDCNWVCIDTLGKIIFNLDNLYPVQEYGNGLACVSNGDEKWFIDVRGNKVFNRTWGDVLSGFSCGYARVRDIRNKEWYYYIDTTGNRPSHLPVDDGSVFTNGLAFTYHSKEKGCIIFDTDGKVLIENLQEHSGLEYEILKVKRNNRWGFIDRQGNILVDFIFNQDRNRAFDYKLKIDIDSANAAEMSGYRNVSQFNNGYAYFQLDSLYGYININGDIVITPQFKGTKSFSEGLAGASLDGEMWGFIDTTGTFIIEPKFGLTDKFTNGICAVRKQYWPSWAIDISDYHMDAIINKKGEIIKEYDMHSFRGLEGEFMKFYEARDFGGKIHYIDKEGNIIRPKR